MCLLPHLWWSTEGVGIEDGLYHYQRLSDVLPHQLVAIVGTLIRAVVEHLQKLRPTKVEHKLCECVCVCGKGERSAV